MSDFVAYYRVSTQRQGATGLGLDAQKTAVQAFVLGVRGQIIGEYQEVESGGTRIRPKLNEAIQLAKSKKATLVIAKLDRLARNVHFVSQLMEAGVEFVAADMPHANRLTVHIIAAVAEYEREMIGQRTRAALRSAKARGVILGNPNAAGQACAASAQARRNADVYALAVRPHVMALRHQGVTSLSKIAAALNAKGVTTPRGKQWSPTAVSNLIKRLEQMPTHAASTAPIRA